MATVEAKAVLLEEPGQSSVLRDILVDDPGPGEVRVRLHREGDDFFLLAVEDDGVGLSGEIAPGGTGIGTKLIRAMAQSLHSAVEYDPTHRGTRATLRAGVK